MIFSQNVFKLASGTNVSLYALNDNSFDFFAFNNGVQKYKLTFEKPTKCVAVNNKQNYHSIIKLNDNTICVCFDDNMTITYEN